MGREIIFRGKRIDESEWAEGSLLSINGNCYIYKGSYGDMEDIDFGYGFQIVSNETVGQYTGLKDKNGKRIFEGDICLHKEYECFGKIEWSYTEACYYFCVCNGNLVFEEEQLYEYVDGLNIIGNIYDNPELLKVQ